jgi:hypothetical protein
VIAMVADNSFGDNLGDGVAGPVGLLIIVLLSVALVFLMRSMNKHLKRVPENFPDPQDAARADATAAPAATSSDTPE